jgi:SH3-like domain-containing protein
MAASLLLISCGSSSSKQQTPAAGIAYAGPNTVNLREDLGPRANAVATVQHGERLEVLETRRRFVRVRTSKGVEGWTDANYLLSQQQVSDLDKLAEFAAKLPSQGAGTTYDALNVHTAPSRQAPSFARIPEGGVVEVLVHRVSPRNAVMPPAAPKTKSKAASKAPPKSAKQGKEPPPPLPPAPAPPANWVDISRPRAVDLSGEVAEVTPVAAPNAPTDDWYLVRTRDGKAGWVLARQISMSIPDEVAQYAERQPITGYLSLGKVGTTDKDNWLWTTMSAAGARDLDFDSFRVFVWSTKRGRYETAYIERNVKGRYPIEPVQTGKGEDAAFSVVLQDKDGQFYQRTYAFSGYRVKMVSKIPRTNPPAVPEVRTSRSFEEEQIATKVSWGDKLRGARKRWFGR